MKIGQPPESSLPNTQPSPLSSAKTGQGAAAVRDERKSAGVGVTVSRLTRVLAQTRAGDASDVDIDKVNAVRLAIEQNSFVVNPQAIADKLLANAREMLQRTSS